MCILKKEVLNSVFDSLTVADAKPGTVFVPVYYYLSVKLCKLTEFVVK